MVPGGSRKGSRKGMTIALIGMGLAALDAAMSLDDLSAVPGWRLEKLKGDRAGQFSLRVNRQYRICWHWDGVDAEKVEIVDDH